MRFSIIIPTYKRADSLARAVSSVIRQTYTDWEVIIVNDSPDDESYTSFASSINNPRIHYHENIMNSGVNFTRNHALDKVSSDSKWVIFLDDDDFLSPDALSTFNTLVLSHQNTKWFVTNRAYTNGVPITKFPRSDTLYSYAWSYLITKRCKGDVTHCIETKLVNNVRFSQHIKQAEEWFFFYQVGLRSKMYYHDHNSTISDGYDQTHGLNFRKRSLEQQMTNVSILLYEGITFGLIYHPTFILYIFMRFLRSFIK